MPHDVILWNIIGEEIRNHYRYISNLTLEQFHMTFPMQITPCGLPNANHTSWDINSILHVNDFLLCNNVTLVLGISAIHAASHCLGQPYLPDVFNTTCQSTECDRPTDGDDEFTAIKTLSYSQAKTYGLEDIRQRCSFGLACPIIIKNSNRSCSHVIVQRPFYWRPYREQCKQLKQKM